MVASNTEGMSEHVVTLSQKVERENLLEEVSGLMPSLQRVHSVAVYEYLSRSKGGTHNKSKCWRFASKILSSHLFDLVMGMVIVFNVVVMVIDIDRSASEEEETSGIHWTEIAGWLVLALFALELAARLCVFQCAFWQDPWNVGDFLLVVTDIVFTLVGLIAGSLFPVSVLRIFRLAKLARVSKVLRVFPELRLLLASLLRSISAIFWGSILLFLTLLVWSMIAVLFINPLNKNMHYDGCERCPRAFSSVSHALLAFSQQIIAGDSWGQVTIPLLEAHPVTVPFFVAVFLTVGLGVLNLVIGVVVEVASQAKALIEEEISAEQVLLKLNKQTLLIDFCKALDKDRDGYVTKKEIQDSYVEDGSFHRILDSVGITPEDFDIVWQVMDPDYKGKVSYKALVNHLCNMKSSDSQFMLAYVKYYITEVRNTLLEEMRQLNIVEAKVEETLEIEHKVEEEMRQVHSMETKVLETLETEHKGEQHLKLEKKDETMEQLLLQHERTIMSPSLQVGKLTPDRDLSKVVMEEQLQDSDDGTAILNKQFIHDLGLMRAEIREWLMKIDLKVSRAALKTPSASREPMDFLPRQI